MNKNEKTHFDVSKSKLFLTLRESTFRGTNFHNFAV